MGVLLSRPAGRRLATLPVLGMLLWSAAAALGQSEDVRIRRAVDTAALQIAAVVTRTVPDEADAILAVEPVRTDMERLTPLGARLRGALQVALLRDYRNARLVAEPGASATAELAVRVAAELQPFDDQVLVLVRIIDRDGFLIDAALIEMARSPGISALLVSAGLPAELPAGTPIAEPSPGLRSASSEPSAPSRPAEPRTPAEASGEASASTSALIDPYEPDDVPGFEVPVPPVDGIRFERLLTRGDRDRFELSVPAPATLTVAAESAIDTLLVLYHAGDSVPFGLHDGRFTRYLQAGTYVLEVIAADSEATGSYVLTARSGAAAPPVPDELDDDALEGLDGPAPELPVADTLPEPAELRSGQPQERVLRQGQEWLALMASPGFYGVTVSSETDRLRASVHRSTETEPLLQLIRSAPGELVGALFIGADAPHLRVDAARGDVGRSYTVSFEPIAPPRVFADQAWVSQPAVGLVGYHALRVFRQGVYQITLESTSQGRAQVTVFQLPAMTTAAAQTPTLGRYELAPGDYFVLVRPRDGRAVGRVCWRAASGSRPCS